MNTKELKAKLNAQDKRSSGMSIGEFRGGKFEEGISLFILVDYEQVKMIDNEVYYRAIDSRGNIIYWSVDYKGVSE